MNQNPSQTLQNGDQIGVYEIKGVIHVGRTTILYRIWNEHMNTFEVLGEYFPEGLARRGEDGRSVEPLTEIQRPVFDLGLKAFLEQADRLSAIKNNNIVRVHNDLEFNGSGYLVMDNEQGTPLVKLIESTFSQTELEYILMSLLEGIQAVHEYGNVHGDIHPSNILIRKSGEPVLIDFAAARLAIAVNDEYSKSLLRSNYSAPEMFKSGYLPQPAADIYSLGATIYQCITHAEPASGEERLSLIEKGETDPVETALKSAGADFSEEFLGTILRMLAPSVARRPQTAGEILTELGGGRDESEAQETVAARDEAGLQISSDSGVSRVLWIGVAVAVLAVMGFLLSGREDKQPEVRETVAQTKNITIKKQLPVKEKSTQEPVGNKEAADASKAVEPAKPEEMTLTKQEVFTKSPEKTPVKVEEIFAEEKTIPAPAGVQFPAALPDSKVEPEIHHPITDSPADIHVTEESVNSSAVKQHLAAADEALQAFRLSTPVGDNAYQHYRAVLDQDPGNVQAKEGMQQIVNRYLWLIDRAFKTGNNHNARVYLQRAEAIQPDNPELVRFRRKLNEE